MNPAKTMKTVRRAVSRLGGPMKDLERDARLKWGAASGTVAIVGKEKIRLPPQQFSEKK